MCSVVLSSCATVKSYAGDFLVIGSCSSKKKPEVLYLYNGQNGPTLANPPHQEESAETATNERYAGDRHRISLGHKVSIAYLHRAFGHRGRQDQTTPSRTPSRCRSRFLLADAGMLSFSFVRRFLGAGDKGATTGGIDHEDTIWISFVLHRP
jgi:hypothetical protein